MLKDSKVYPIYENFHNRLSEENSYLKGKLLTLADATFSDPIQRKAFKDLLSQEIENHFHDPVRHAIVIAFRDVAVLVGEELFKNYGADPPTDSNCIAN